MKNVLKKSRGLRFLLFFFIIINISKIEAINFTSLIFVPTVLANISENLLNENSQMSHLRGSYKKELNQFNRQLDFSECKNTLCHKNSVYRDTAFCAVEPILRAKNLNKQVSDKVKTDCIYLFCDRLERDYSDTDLCIEMKYRK